MRVLFLLIIVAACLLYSCKPTHENSYVSTLQSDTAQAEGNSKSFRQGVASVNSHGVALDTDGDGIPDYKDKELLTLQKCFPADSNGVGNCPDPFCCKDFDPGMVDDFSCHLQSTLEVKIAGKSKVLTNSAKLLLGMYAREIKANPECKIRIGAAGGVSKRSVELSWSRINAVIRYLVDQEGISQERFIFGFDVEEDANTVGLFPANENGPNIVPAPRPNRKKPVGE